MDEPRSHSNESNPDDMMTKKDLKELKVSIYTRYTFLFDGSIIGTPWLSVLYWEQFYVGWTSRNCTISYNS